MRVSLMAVGQQTVMDSYLCLIHLTVGVVFGTLTHRCLPALCTRPLGLCRSSQCAPADDVFNAFAFAAFLKFIVFALFEMRYLMLIWKSRRPNVRRHTTHRTTALTWFFFLRRPLTAGAACVVSSANCTPASTSAC